MKRGIAMAMSAGILLGTTACGGGGTGGGAASRAAPQFAQENIDYQVDGHPHRGVLIYDAAAREAQPVVVVVPNWLGVTEPSIEKAKRAVGEGHVVFVADMFGDGRQPADTDEAAEAVGALYGNRLLMRERAHAALEAVRELAAREGAPWRADASRIAAIGFCFGGATVLELARSGADLDAVVSLHGNLALEAEAPEPVFRAAVLALHGDADPYVPQSEVDAFLAEMRDSGADDWRFISYGGAVHSFTNPLADMPGQAMYDERIAKDAFRQTRQFLADRFEAGSQ